MISEVKSETCVASAAQKARVPEPRTPIAPGAMGLYQQRRLCCWPLLRLLSLLGLERLYQPSSQRVSSLLLFVNTHTATLALKHSHVYTYIHTCMHACIRACIQLHVPAHTYNTATKILSLTLSLSHLCPPHPPAPLPRTPPSLSPSLLAPTNWTHMVRGDLEMDIGESKGGGASNGGGTPVWTYLLGILCMV